MSVAENIYFDNAATTPLDGRVVEAMRPFWEGAFGNPSSLHHVGRRARAAVDQARSEVADLIGADLDEIIFTASGTEADNLALIGAFEAHDQRPFHVVTTAIEHPAILETCRYLRKWGGEITLLNPDRDGIVAPESLAAALRPHTRLVSIMAANNVVGTVQPLSELAAVAKSHGAIFHTDAVQAVGKVPLDMRRLKVDLLSLSGHKLHGPKGVGALYVRKGVQLAPLVHGGGQERGLRSATENVAGIVGLGCACRIAAAEMADQCAALVGLRDRLWEGIQAVAPGAYLIGDRYRRLPGHLCLAVAGMEGEAMKLLLALDELGVAVSAGSACSSHHAGEPSATLVAMGMDPVRARGSLRLTLGRFNSQEDVTRFLRVLPTAVGSLRSIATR